MLQLLSFDHESREPTRCWKCGKVGHASPHCPLRTAQRNFKSQPSWSKPAQQLPFLSSFNNKRSALPHLKASLSTPVLPMERRLSFGSVSGGSRPPRRVESHLQGRPAAARGSAVNYPGDPRFRPRCAYKMATISSEMEQHCQHLSDHAIVITEEGPMGVRSREEVKDIIQHHLGIRKLQFSVVYSHPEPFTALFQDAHDRDVVFAAGRVVDGPVELGFHTWDVDRFGDREILPYHVRLCLEGIPRHAWNIVEKVLCDEAMVLHVNEDTQRRIDQRTFDCWVVTKDPSKLPQMVFLSLTKHQPGLGREVQLNLSKPRGILNAHVFRVLIHIDAVEDLLFYHYPREEMIEYGKVPWRDFR
jgi:hypothetical protein